MWEAIRPVLRGTDPVRIESPITSGIPDVNCTLAWVELKYKSGWPKRATTPLRVDHFTPEQRAWLTRRCRAGGSAYLLLKVGDSEWLLFWGETAARVLGVSTREELYKHATARWWRLPKPEELQQCLRKG